MNRYVIFMHTAGDKWHPPEPPLQAIKHALVPDPGNAASRFFARQPEERRRKEMLEWLDEQEVDYHFTIDRHCYKQDGDDGPIAVTADCVMLCLNDDDAAFWFRVAYDKKPLPEALDLVSILQGSMNVAKAHWL